MSSEQKAPRILVIDDVEEVRSTVRRILARNGYEILEADNGRTGLGMIEQHDPDAVIMDIFMPEMEGLETIRRAAHSKPNLPIIAVTGSVETSFLKVALRFGAVYGLYKPFSHKELLETVHQALNHHKEVGSGKLSDAT